MQHVLECQLKGIGKKFEVMVWLVAFEKKKKSNHLIRGVMW